MCAYKHSSLAIETARKLIAVKIERQSTLLRKYGLPALPTKVKNKISINDILLEEGRVAQKFWHQFRKLLPKTDFMTRQAKSADPANHLLDLGYHHIMNVIKKILNKYSIPADLGLLHVARKSDSTPLVYDLMEMFRSDIVDAEVLKFLRMKKKVPRKINIAHFLHEINERLEKKYYLKDFKVCHSYTYYMEIQILKFIKAVNHKEVFNPLTLPVRHEHRCRGLTTELSSGKVNLEVS